MKWAFNVGVRHSVLVTMISFHSDKPITSLHQSTLPFSGCQIAIQKCKYPENGPRAETGSLDHDV